MFELLEVGERELARELVKSTIPLQSLKVDHPDRYMKIEQLSLRPYFNASDAYEMGRFEYFFLFIKMYAVLLIL